jgi:hypothetical protein
MGVAVGTLAPVVAALVPLECPKAAGAAADVGSAGYIKSNDYIADPEFFVLVRIEARFLLTIPARVHVTPSASATLAGVEEGCLAGWRCA